MRFVHLIMALFGMLILITAFQNISSVNNCISKYSWHKLVLRYIYDWYYSWTETWSLYFFFHLKVFIIEKVLNFCDEWLVLWFLGFWRLNWFEFHCLVFCDMPFWVYLWLLDIFVKVCKYGQLSWIQVMQFNSPNLWNGNPFDFNWGPMYNFIHCHVILQLNVWKLIFLVLWGFKWDSSELNWG